MEMWKRIRDLSNLNFPLVENSVYHIRIVEGINHDTGQDVYEEYLVIWKNGVFVGVVTDDVFEWDDVDDILI